MSEGSYLDWTAVGERWLEKDPCEQCEGKGSIVSESMGKCRSCDGIGWLANESEGEILCPECKGMKKMLQSQSSDCPACGSKGYMPKLMQRFEAVDECEFCAGEGGHLEENGDHEECFDCGGTGLDDRRKQYFTHKEWKASKFRADVREVFEDDEGIPYKFELKSGGGGWISRDYIEYCEACPICLGSGAIPSTVLMKCKFCGGDGDKRVEESRVV